MLFLKRLFNFYIKSSFHLGICLICLYVVSINKLEININYVLIIFLFCSTFFTYNFIKYGKKILKKLSNQNLTLNLIKYLSFFCLLILINTLFYLNLDTILFSVFLFVLCLLYAYPFAGLKSNFRNFSKVKLFFVAICWSGSVVVLPILEIAMHTDSDKIYKCNIRGKFRSYGIKSTNPVACNKAFNKENHSKY